MLFSFGKFSWIILLISLVLLFSCSFNIWCLISSTGVLIFSSPQPLFLNPFALLSGIFSQIYLSYFLLSFSFLLPEIFKSFFCLFLQCSFLIAFYSYFVDAVSFYLWGCQRFLRKIFSCCILYFLCYLFLFALYSAFHIRGFFFFYPLKFLIILDCQLKSWVADQRADWKLWAWGGPLSTSGDCLL